MTDYWQYNFPPFFTIQPNDETRRLQMEAWNAIVLDHCRRNRLFVLNVADAVQKPPFRNDAIARSLTEESALRVLEEMEKRGRIEWLKSDRAERDQCLVYWLKVEEWADMIKQWVDSAALQGTMCTLYEIVSDERSSPELASLDQRILMKALRHLEREGKAVLVKVDNSYGVKFI